MVEEGKFYNYGREGAHRDQLRGLYMSLSMFVWLYVCSIDAGTLTCSRVAKVSVCPKALRALREQTKAFEQQTRQTLLKDACCHGTEGKKEASDQVFPCVRPLDIFAHLLLYYSHITHCESDRLPPLQLSFHSIIFSYSGDRGQLLTCLSI